MGYFLLTEKSIFEKTQRQINRISVAQLERAAVEIKATGKCTDSDIFALERQVQVVAKSAPNSYAKCYEQAVYIKGMLALWITLNSSDLKSPLVLTLAGVEILDANYRAQSASYLYAATATINPVAVTQFFEATCSAIFENLLHHGSTNSGLLEPVSTYFGTVETNGRGMLHLHCLVWLDGFFHLSAFRKRLLSEPGYKDRMAE